MSGTAWWMSQMDRRKTNEPDAHSSLSSEIPLWCDALAPLLKRSGESGTPKSNILSQL